MRQLKPGDWKQRRRAVTRKRHKSKKLRNVMRKLSLDADMRMRMLPPASANRP